MAISILLADDHVILRQGLRAILDAEADLQIVGEAGDGLETLNLVEKLQPDVLVLDLVLPGLGGLEVARQVHQQYPRIHIVVLSMYTTEAYIVQALKNGAQAYVRKGSGASELIEAIHTVVAGGRYLSPPFTENRIVNYLKRTQTDELDPYETLTNRERQVFHLMTEGLSTTEIAQRLVISPRTAEIHRAKVMDKLGLNNPTDLIRYAVQRGILLVEKEPSAERH